MFFIAEFERAAKIWKITVYRFLISLSQKVYGHGRQFRYFINLRSLTQGDEENRTR